MTKRRTTAPASLTLRRTGVFLTIAAQKSRQFGIVEPNPAGFVSKSRIEEWA